MFMNCQVRNKPIDPPKKPEKAPFFLPSAPSLSGDILFDTSVVSGGERVANSNTLCSTKKADLSSSFMLLLKSCADMQNCKPVY